MIDPTNSDEPLYRQVVRVLVGDMESGRLPVGTRLPTEQELSARLNVSRHTVREALRHLRSDGRVMSRQGSGSVIVEKSQSQRYVHAVSHLSELFQYASETRLVIDKSSVVVADAKLAARLDCSPKREWLHMEGIRYSADDMTPIGASDIYVHATYGRIRNFIGKRPGPIYAWIESEYDERVVEVRQTIRATAIPDHLAEPLNAPAGSPALEIERVYRSDRNKVIEIAFSIHPADRFSYSATLRRQVEADPETT